MIVLKITERIKPTPPVVSWTAPKAPYVQPTVNTAIYAEVSRRDAVIKQLVKDFKHVVGDVLEPANPDDLKKWGKCLIIGICSEYIHLEKDHKWPANDNPMIITASSDNGEIFYATTNYFKQ